MLNVNVTQSWETQERKHIRLWSWKHKGLMTGNTGFDHNTENSMIHVWCFVWIDIIFVYLTTFWTAATLWSRPVWTAEPLSALEPVKFVSWLKWWGPALCRARSTPQCTTSPPTLKLISERIQNKSSWICSQKTRIYFISGCIFTQVQEYLQDHVGTRRPLTKSYAVCKGFFLQLQATSD